MRGGSIEGGMRGGSPSGLLHGGLPVRHCLPAAARRGRRTAAPLLRLLCIILLIVGAFLLGAYTAPANAAVRAGAPAPALSGRDLDGQSHSLDDYRGKWVYVDFWASWCGPCMRMLPSVVSLHKELGGSPNFAVLGVSLDSEQTRGALLKAVKKNGVTYPVIFGDSSELADGWGVSEIPATFLIDPEGTVVGEDIPVSQVKALIEQDRPTGTTRTPASLSAGGAALKPVQVKCTERLLPISDSSGRDGGRDLEITLDLPAARPKLSKYRLYLRAHKRVDGQLREVNWRYDVNVFMDPSNTRAPYYVEFTDLTVPADARTFAPPEIQAALDPDGNRCQFVVTLAPDTAKLNYAVALLTPQ